MVKPIDRQGMPPREYAGEHFGMVPDSGAPRPPLPFSDVDPMTQDEALAGMMGEEEAAGQGNEVFDANAETAPKYWPIELAELWPNLPPETREIVDSALGEDVVRDDTGSDYA